MKRGDKIYPPIVIMLSGKARSGKDTIGEIIRHEIEVGIVTEDNFFQSPVATLGFADLLKAVSKRNHGYEGKAVNRKVLLDVGDEMRAVDKDVFVKPILHFIDVYKKMGYGVIVITDTRYANEYECIENYPNGVPYVIRIDSTNGHNGVEDYTKEHCSEQLDVPFNFILEVGKLDKESYPKLVTKIRRILADIVDDYMRHFSGNVITK